MENWRDELPDTLKANPTIQQYKTLDDALNGLIEMKSLRGRSVVIPNDDSDPAEVKAYVDKLIKTGNGKVMLHPDYADNDEYTQGYNELHGIPTEVGGYGEAEVSAMTPEVVKNVMEMAFDIGLSKKHTLALLAKLDGQADEQTTALAQLKTDDQGVITQKFGGAETQQKAKIQQLIADNEDPDHPLGELNAAAWLMLNNIVGRFEGKGPQVFNQPSGDARLTPGEVRAKIAENTDEMLKGGRQMGKVKYNALLKKNDALRLMLPG